MLKGHLNIFCDVGRLDTTNQLDVITVSIHVNLGLGNERLLLFAIVVIKSSF
jgi:hypothetical protein